MSVSVYLLMHVCIFEGLDVYVYVCNINYNMNKNEMQNN
jgi:hypothetical protein